MTATTTSGLDSAFKRYRIMAWVTGTLLAVLVFVAMPLKYIWDIPGPVAVFGFLHGWLFIVYLAVTLQLGLKMQWSWLSLAMRMLAGTVPLAAFFVEHKVHGEVQALTR